MRPPLLQQSWSVSVRSRNWRSDDNTVQNDGMRKSLEYQLQQQYYSGFSAGLSQIMAGGGGGPMPLTYRGGPARFCNSFKPAADAFRANLVFFGPQFVLLCHTAWWFEVVCKIQLSGLAARRRHQRAANVVSSWWCSYRSLFPDSCKAVNGGKPSSTWPLFSFHSLPTLLLSLGTKLSLKTKLATNLCHENHQYQPATLTVTRRSELVLDLNDRKGASSGRPSRLANSTPR